MDTAPSEDKSGLSSRATHRRAQKSTTLNRNYVKKPAASTRVSTSLSEEAVIDSVAKRRAEDLKRRQALADKINRERMAALKSGKSIVEHPTPSVKTAQIPAPSPEPKPLSASIERSLTNPKPEKTTKKLKKSTLESAITSTDTVSASDSATFSARTAFGPKRLLLAFGCAALAVGVVAYFISVNTPDLSVRVAAMQSGIEASYPSYIPRGFNLSDITSENGKISMTFTSSDGSFTLTEEKSTWDNTALESNYIKSTWGQNYTIVREQGISLYVSGSDAAWLNGGILYKIDTSGTTLTKKQLKTIATSL